MFTQPFHDFHNNNAFLSEDGALAVVVEDFPQKQPYQTRDKQGFPVSDATKRSEAAPRVSPLALRGGAPHEKGAGGVSDPPFFGPLVRHRRGGPGAPEWSHHLPSPLGGRSLPQ